MRLAIGATAAGVALAAAIAGPAQAAPPQDTVARAAPPQGTVAQRAAAPAAPYWAVYGVYDTRSDCVVLGHGLVRSGRFLDYLCEAWGDRWELWVQVR